ncbi:MAG: galactokinase [Anaerolineae bacterium]
MTHLLTPDELLARFAETFSRPATVLLRAPGRVNLIGEHTDYNDGFVLPMAIERETRVAAAPRDDGQVRLVALDLGRETFFAVAGVAPTDEETWSNYVRGVAAGLLGAGYPLRGMDALIQGDVPIGAGLSSSAALEMAAIQAFSAVGDFTVPRDEAARIGQRAEHTFVGTMCGLMDQLASALGQPDHALLIDCRDLSYQPVPLPAGVTILIADTAVRRQLAASAYNERRAQCETAARALGVPALRDATPAMLDATALEPIVAMRARHVVTENARVLQTVAALRAGDLQRVGELIDASHASLRNLYQVSSPELDTMVELLRAQPGCYGARLTGAGFGGCAVALMRAEALEAAITAVAEAYQARTGLTPALYPTRAAAGAGILPVLRGPT